jgi:ATP-dependent DNA helicase PIF1
MKVYAVAIGRIPGIYTTWAEAQDQTRRYEGAKFKSFETMEEAEEFMAANPTPPPEEGLTIGELNAEQSVAFEAVMAGKSIFITGPGGTGKSFLLQALYRNYKRITGKSLAVTAMTGCAALLLGPWAKTLHSWAGIGLGRTPVDSVVSYIRSDYRKKKRWMSTGCLVIDEVSMLTPALLEYLDEVGRRLRNSPRPFGGIQLVFVGDFYQLPPVVRESQKASFAFQSPLWDTVVEESILLKQIIRQKDPVFQGILNEARVGALTAESYAALEARKTTEWKRQEIKPTLLFTKNHDVASINAAQLNKLTTECRVFLAKTVARPPRMTAEVLENIVAKLDRDAPYETELHLKVQSQVMLLTNQDPAAGLVNGSRGIITGFTGVGDPIVKFMNGKTVTVVPAQWSSEAETEADAVKREQIPLRLAYALTIHKAQGASLDSALIDVGESTFEYGQAYVALSRVRSMEALYIFDIKPGAFRANPAVAAFYAKIDAAGAAHDK